MEDMENIKASVKVNSMGASAKASTKASMEVMESFAEVMGSTEVTSMEA